VTWNAEQESINVDLTANGVDIIDQTFTDDSPLDACAPLAPICQDVCIDIQNLNITDQGACGELIFNATCFLQIGPFSLGRFYLGENCVIPESDEVIAPFTGAIDEKIEESVSQEIAKAIAEKIPGVIGKLAARIEAQVPRRA